MWNTFLGKLIKLSLAEIVLALIPCRKCNYQFRNRHDSLTLCNTRMVTFELVAVKVGARDFLSCIFCASYSLFVFVIYCAFIHYSFIYFVRCSIILFHFHLSFVDCCSKEKKNNSDPELCSGILIP
jgi:hypothetical protein